MLVCKDKMDIRGKTFTMMEDDVSGEEWLHVNDTVSNTNSVLIRYEDLDEFLTFNDGEER